MEESTRLAHHEQPLWHSPADTKPTLRPDPGRHPVIELDKLHGNAWYALCTIGLVTNIFNASRLRASYFVNCIPVFVFCLINIQQVCIVSCSRVLCVRRPFCGFGCLCRALVPLTGRFCWICSRGFDHRYVASAPSSLRVGGLNRIKCEADSVANSPSVRHAGQLFRP